MGSQPIFLQHLPSLPLLPTPHTHTHFLNALIVRSFDHPPPTHPHTQSPPLPHSHTHSDWGIVNFSSEWQLELMAIVLNGILRKIIAIGYLPVVYVRQKFHQLTQSTNARFLKNAYPQLNFFFEYFEHTLFTTLSPPPRMCTMSMRALILYVQSTHARDITTYSMSQWEKSEPNFFENPARRKTGKSQLFAIQIGIPQSSPKKGLERSNFQFQNRFESRNLKIDEYWTNMSCLPEYIA